MSNRLATVVVTVEEKATPVLSEKYRHNYAKTRDGTRRKTNAKKDERDGWHHVLPKVAQTACVSPILSVG